MAGQLIARSILWGDERWRLFSPFELVWAGGATGRIAGQVIGMWGRGSSAAGGALARYRERQRTKERLRDARLAEANRQAGTRSPRSRPPPGRPSVDEFRVEQSRLEHSRPERSRPERPRPSVAATPEGDGTS
jgi:hypothetical protein